MVLLGGSRIQLGISLGTLSAGSGRKHITQLAIDGTSPMATLRDLAENSQFSGLVVCSLFAPAFEPANWNAQQPWIDHYYRDFAVTSRLKRVFSGTLQRYLVLANSGKPKYLTTQFDRSRSADYSQVDLTRHRQIRLDVGQRMFQTQRASPAAWLAQARIAESYVHAIQQRGGDVVFIRLPSSAPLYQLEERCYPRREYWDCYARISRATLVHFEDIPGWRRFTCPDLSHLDRSGPECLYRVPGGCVGRAWSLETGQFARKSGSSLTARSNAASVTVCFDDVTLAFGENRRRPLLNVCSANWSSVTLRSAARQAKVWTIKAGSLGRCDRLGCGER